MPHIDEIKKQHLDEWVLVEILSEDESGQTIEARLIVHSKNRDVIYKAMLENKDKYTHQFFTGEIPVKGYAVAFNKTKTDPDQLLKEWLQDPVTVEPTDSVKDHDLVF